MNDKINNKPYTSEEKEIIFEMHSQGFNCKEIGDKLGKSNKAINKFLHRNNLNTNQSILNKLAADEIFIWKEKKKILKNYHSFKIIYYVNTVLTNNVIIISSVTHRSWNSYYKRI